jgi:5'-3' exonuclease
LDDIKGVGKKTRVALLRKLGSLEAISAASEDDLIAAGASAKQARAIVDHLRTAAPETSDSEDTALENAFLNDDPTEIRPEFMLERPLPELSELQQPSAADDPERAPLPQDEPVGRS